MRKFLSLLLALGIVLNLAAGCTSGSSETESIPGSTAAGASPDYANSTVILYTGNLRGEVSVYAQIAAAKSAYQAEGATVYLVDAGNYLQGTAYANSDRGLSIYTLMDAAGYDVAAMGVYEFVYGDATTGYVYHSNLHRYYTQAELYLGAEALEYQANGSWAEEPLLQTREAKEAAAFQVICSNLTVGADATGYYAFESSAVLTDALTIGFVSYVDESVVDFIQDGYLSGYSFVTPAQPECDILVALGGGEGDIVISAPADGALTVGAYIIDNATGRITQEAVDLTVADADLTALISDLTVDTVIGQSQVTLNGADSSSRNGETNLGDLTTDALLWYAQNYVEELRDVPVIAIQNGGNCDNFLYSGDITETDLLNALPFSPMGVGIVYVTGAELLETLEAATQTENCPGWAQVAGITYTVDTSAAYDAGEAYGDYYKANSINRVTIHSVGGEELDLSATYAVIADNYLMNGNDTYYIFAAIKEAGENYTAVSTSGGLKTRDIVALYIQEVLGGIVGSGYADIQGRITLQ